MAKILVVDEEEKVRKLACKILSRKYPDYEIIEANDGAIGLELIKVNDFDLVLTDWCMRKMDGDKMIAAAKEADRMPARIIVMTGGNLEECFSRFLCFFSSLKHAIYLWRLPKPFDNEQLIEEVAKALAWSPPR